MKYLRPEGWQDRLIKNWQRAALPQDITIHLGDVILGRQSELPNILASIAGRKILVMGNHDKESAFWYMRHGFDFACKGLLWRGVWFTHAPQTNLPDGAILNVHGHLHVDHHPEHNNRPAHCKLLSLETDGLAPVEFEAFTGITKLQQQLLGEV
jgi:calcineurin-like phosphoesterase family protein